MKKKSDRLLDMFEKEKESLIFDGVFCKGTINKRWMTCGHPSCGCKEDKQKRHGPYYWWTTKEEGKTKAILIPKDLLSEAKTYLENHKKLKGRMKRLCQLSEQILRKKIEISKSKPKENK